MTVDLIGENEARSDLRAHQTKILDCYARAWDLWKEMEGTLVRSAPRYRPTSRANVFYDLLTEQIEQAFEGVEGTALTRKPGFLVLTLNSRLVIRFKKFQGRTLKTSQIMTFQQQRISRQELDLGINATTVVVGYVLDGVGSEIAKIAAVCPLEGENVWTIYLDEEEGGQGLLPLPLPHGGGGAPKPIVRSSSEQADKKNEQPEGK